MSNVFYLSIVTTWVWACLVFLPNNHMRVIIIGPVYVSVRSTLVVVIHLLTKAYEHIDEFGDRVARFGHFAEKEKQCSLN